MIERLELSAQHFELNDDFKKYIRKKVGQLDKYVSRKSRGSLHGEVKLGQSKSKNKADYSCEIVLHLPHRILTVKESAINMYAAIDIAESKIKIQLTKYKNLSSRPKIYHRLMRHVKKS